MMYNVQVVRKDDARDSFLEDFVLHNQLLIFEVKYFLFDLQLRWFSWTCLRRKIALKYLKQLGV